MALNEIIYELADELVNPSEMVLEEKVEKEREEEDDAMFDFSDLDDDELIDLIASE